MSIKCDRSGSFAYPLMQWNGDQSGQYNSWRLSNRRDSHSKALVLHGHLFWNAIICVDIAAAAQQSFPEYNQKYNPNGRHCHKQCLNKEVGRVYKLQYWHQPNLIGLKATQRWSRYEYTNLIYNLEPTILSRMIQPNIWKIYYVHLQMKNNPNYNKNIINTNRMSLTKPWLMKYSHK